MSDKNFLSKRAKSLAPSATIAMNNKAKQLKEDGKDVISFTLGEPDFKTPSHICADAKKAIDAGMHSYTVCAGIPELRKAIVESFKRDIGITYQPNQIVVSPGSKFSLFLTMQALLDEGDEVIIPAPYWVSYPEMVSLCGGKPVIVNTREEDGFSLKAADLEKAITPKTKLVLLNSPSNPTGGIIPPETIDEIGLLLEKKGLWCLTDEIYDKLIYGENKHKSIAAVSDYCLNHTIVVNGCSKTYAMTGWRIGWIAAPQVVAKTVDDLQSQMTSNACSIAQAAAVEALNGPQQCVADMHNEFAKRRELIVRLLNEIPGVNCQLPAGAFYAFPNISGLFGKNISGKLISTPDDFCMLALEKAYVGMVAGEPFGSDKHIRLSYATSEKNIQEGCKRLKNLVENNL